MFLLFKIYIYLFLFFIFFLVSCLHAIADSIFSLMNIFFYVFLCILESNKIYKYFLYLWVPPYIELSVSLVVSELVSNLVMGSWGLPHRTRASWISCKSRSFSSILIINILFYYYFPSLSRLKNWFWTGT